MLSGLFTSLGIMRPTVVLPRPPALYRTLVFFVHNRSDSRTYPSINVILQPRIENVTRMAFPGELRGKPHISRRDPWESRDRLEKSYCQWIRDSKIQMGTCLYRPIAIGKPQLREILQKRSNDFSCSAPKAHSIHGSLLDSLNILNESYLGGHSRYTRRSRTMSKATGLLENPNSNIIRVRASRPDTCMPRASRVDRDSGSLISSPERPPDSKKHNLYPNNRGYTSLGRLDYTSQRREGFINIAPGLCSTEKAGQSGNTVKDTPSPSDDTLKAGLGTNDSLSKIQVEAYGIQRYSKAPQECGEKSGPEYPASLGSGVDAGTMETNPVYIPKLSPADLIASLRYYDRKRGTLPDEEPLTTDDIAFLESTRTNSSRARGPTLTPNQASSISSSAWKARAKKIGLTFSILAGAYALGIGHKLISAQPGSTAAAELLTAVQQSKGRKVK